MTYTVRLATPQDAQGIIEILYPGYFSETVYKGLTPDLDNTSIMVHQYLHDKTCIVAEKDGEIVAFAAILIGRTYYKELEADIDFFLVDKAHRSSGLSRTMVQACLDVADHYKAAVVYAGCASSISEHNDKLWQNLWSKFGFVKLGTTMIRI